MDMHLIDVLPVFGGHDVDVTEFLPTLAGWSSVIGIVLALLMILASALLNRRGSGRSRWNVSGKFLTTAFAVVWLAGFVIYDVGMYICHSPMSLLTNMPMAIVHAFDMFLIDSDVAAIHQQFHDNWIFMGCFSLVHLLAAVITLVFVIKHFGFNIIAACRMFIEAYLSRSKRETFVFWGLNDASYLLARSIKRHYGNARDYRIIVVRTNQDGEETSVKNGMERLFNFLSLNNNDLERLQELDCLTTSTYADLAGLNLDQNGDGDCRDILKKQIGLKQVARILDKKTSGEIHLFLLTDDADANIQAVSNLKGDLTINEASNSGKRVFLYCQARYNSVHRVIEDEQLQDNIVVKVIDSSHIGVEMLKQRVELQPVSYVQIEKDATVSTAFNSLVVGFGEVGHDSVRFLYEFGAFVKTGSGKDRVERSDFHCDIVDRDIRNKAGLFAVNAPMVSSHMTYSKDGATPESLITLHDMDVLGMDFYNYLERAIKTLNYVVLALDDDVMNVSLAVRIFRLAVHYRPDMKRFRILARVRNDRDGHLLRIAEHYNRLWAAQQCSSSDTRHIHQGTVKNTDHIHEPITLFGSWAETYTYDYIVSDRLKEEAKRFKERYDQSILSLNGKSGGGMATPLAWEGEHRDLMQLTGDYKGYSPTLSGIMRLRRVQAQNMQNCFHKFTKQRLAETALGTERSVLLSRQFLTRKENEITYAWQGHEEDDAVTRVLDVLAQTEHLRWMASHEILGYRDTGGLDDKDEARLLHGCLKPWHELTSVVKSYDYNVVDASLGII